MVSGDFSLLHDSFQMEILDWVRLIPAHYGFIVVIRGLASGADSIMVLKLLHLSNEMNLP